MSECKIEIKTLTYPCTCDKCGIHYPEYYKFLTIDTAPDDIDVGELIVICSKCLRKLKNDVTR